MDLLALAEFVYNNVQHTLTHMFPFLQTYGFNLRMFPLLPSDPVLATTNFLQELAATHLVLQDQLNRAKEDCKRFSDQHQCDVPPLAASDRV